MPAGDPDDLRLEVLTAMVRATLDGLVILDRHLRCAFANAAACTMLGYGLDDLQGRDLVELEPRLGRERLAAAFGGKPVRWETVLRRRDVSELVLECTATRLDPWSRGLLFLILRDVSEQRRQAMAAAALAQAAASVAVSDSIDDTVRSLAESALRGTRALGVTVVLNDEDEIAAWIGAAGLPASYVDNLRASIRAGYRSVHHDRLMAEKRMFVVPDARRGVESDPKRLGLDDPDWKSIRWQASVVSPLIYQRAVVGTLNAMYREGELPSEGELAFLVALADQAAVAAMNARLLTASREKATLEERQRLSRELHDSVSQALYGIALGARTARDRAEHDPARVVQPIDYVLQLAEGGIAEMRALIFELRPESLETEGLVAALGKQVDAVRARHGIAARTIAHVEPVLPFGIKQALYRIVQEALQNTVKHAQAGRVEVRLEVHDGVVRLTIEDDGLGFEPDGAFPGHLGLRSMRERALGVGASLEVASAPGHGTRILVSVPLPPQADTAVA